MSLKIEEMPIESIVIDVANTRDVARKIELARRDAAKRGVSLHIYSINFPILNQYPDLPRDLQVAIWELISDKILLERKLLSIELNESSNNSFKSKKIKNPNVEAQLVKIFDLEKDIKPRNYLDSAKTKCVEYLISIDSPKAKEFASKDKVMFSQYIRRIRKNK